MWSALLAEGCSDEADWSGGRSREQVESSVLDVNDVLTGDESRGSGWFVAGGLPHHRRS